MSIRIRRFLEVFALAAVTLAVTVQPVLAHGIEILRSDPVDGAVLTAAPQVARAWFSSELSVEDSYMEVFDSTGKKVDLNDSAVDPDDAEHKSMRVGLPALGDGIYVVRWQAMLPDGDSTLGTFQFTVSSAPYPAAEPKAVVESAGSGYPGPVPDEGGAGGFIKGIFENRNTTIGAVIGGLAILLGLLVLVRRLFTSRD